MIKQVLEVAKASQADALTAFGPLPEGISVGQFLADYSAVGPMDHYRHVPLAAAAAVARVKDALGPEATRAFLRAALAGAVVDVIAFGRLERLPARIVGHHSRQLERISLLCSKDDESFTLDNDLFLKDLGLATLRLLAAAAQLLDVRCGIPRSLVLNSGLRAAPGNLVRILRLGGFRPYMQIHTHLRNLDDFNEQGWEECYRCCAELYQVRPDLLGMYGSSWFYDPALAEISPRLSYLRDTPLSGGAELFFVEEGGEAIANALSTSASRRKLFEEGKYRPRSFMIVWGRRAQSDWALAAGAN